MHPYSCSMFSYIMPKSQIKSQKSLALLFYPATEATTVAYSIVSIYSIAWALIQIQTGCVFV